MMTPAYLIHGDNVTVIVEGEQYNAVRGQHPNFDRILEAIREADWDNIIELFDIKHDIASALGDLVEIRGNRVFFDGEPFHNALADRIVELHENGLPIESLVEFLKNLMRNPSRTSVQELYLFLESGNMPITEDGCFLAYKKVRNDYTDIFSGRFDNSPGQTVEVARNTVDDKRDNTCSYGLHFCSKSYLGSFGSCANDRVVIVKIDPADVVSIPSDYNNTKGRCCRYEVIAEWEGYRDEKDAFTRPVYTSSDMYTDFGYGDAPDYEYADRQLLTDEVDPDDYWPDEETASDDWWDSDHDSNEEDEPDSPEWWQVDRFR